MFYWWLLQSIGNYNKSLWFSLWFEFTFHVFVLLSWFKAIQRPAAFRHGGISVTSCSWIHDMMCTMLIFSLFSLWMVAAAWMHRYPRSLMSFWLSGVECNRPRSPALTFTSIRAQPECSWSNEPRERSQVRQRGERGKRGKSLLLWSVVNGTEERDRSPLLP